MANKIILKKTSTASKVPLSTDLEVGEIAVNLADQKLYSKNASGTVVLVGQGTGGSGTVTSVGITPSTGVTVSGSPVTTSGNITVGLSTKLTAIENLSGAGFITQNGSGVIAGRTIQAGTGISVAHGNGSSQDPVITNSGVTSVNGVTGAVTATNLLDAIKTVDGAGSGLDADTLDGNSSAFFYPASNPNGYTANSGTVTSVATGTGLTGGTITTSGTVSLANTAVTAGSYTNANITVDAQGRLTSASSGAGGGVTSISGTANEIDVSASTGAVTISLPATINANLNGNASTATTATNSTNANNLNSYGVQSNLDTFYNSGEFAWADTTTGKPEAYGQGIGIVSSGTAWNGSNNWYTQLAFGTSGSSGYFRTRVNAGGWGSWYTLIHSGNIGSQSVNYASSAGNADTVDGYHVSTSGSANTIPTRNGSGYLAPANWTQFDGYYGIYSPNNGAHFYPNPNTYGSWKCDGTRNGWAGIEFSSGVVLMMNRNTVGMYDTSYGWNFYWSNGTLYCFKNANGGGTQATVLDSSNYTSYPSAGTAKVWARYTPSNGAVQASKNVSSVTSGVPWTVNFASALPNANYSVVVGNGEASGDAFARPAFISAVNAGNVQFRTPQNYPSLQCIAVFNN